MQQIQAEKSGKSWYDKWYIVLMAIPVIITLLSLVYLGVFYSKNNEFIYKDVSLSGGSTITINTDIDTVKIESDLKQKFPDITTRKLTDLRTGQQIAFIIESSAKPEELEPAIEEILGYALTDENSSVEFTGPALSQSFYSELIKVVFISFILMAMIIFIIFGQSIAVKSLAVALSFCAVRLTFINRPFILVLVILICLFAFAFALIKLKTKKEKIYLAVAFLVSLAAVIFPYYNLIYLIAVLLFTLYIIESLPSIAVIFAAFSDIIIALVIIDILQIKMSAAGIAAFLMLIGYSVDTDILLTTRALQREDTLNKRIYRSFKTGLLMTLTGLAAVLPVFFIVTGIPESFRQIFLILALGLGADIVNTWLTNAGIIKWYCQKRGIK